MGMVAKRFREPGGGQASARELHGHSSPQKEGRGRRWWPRSSSRILARHGWRWAAVGARTRMRKRVGRRSCWLGARQKTINKGEDAGLLGARRAQD
ncbi:hypothetical protein BDA96_03G111000 [Sorghum bicolor]|uniref:Uncharacterized protein n=1 Tax=Sorghum bicolor TaxID=4558 RepID=A0A921ULW8_SORBI|nr:hypothetical protein BDA96_03G111000 [Sorghum bicolor]